MYKTQSVVSIFSLGLLCMQRTEATVRAPDGSCFKVTKGAAHAVLGLIQTNTEVIASSVNNKVLHVLSLK